MKMFKYCEYNLCKNYKKRDHTLCYVHDKKKKSSMTTDDGMFQKSILTIIFVITVVSVVSVVYDKDFNVYINTTVSEYKHLIDQCGYDKYIYEYVWNTVSNISETCIRLYNDLVV